MKILDSFNPEEMHLLCERSDAQAWFAFILNWGIIASSFALVAFWPNPFTVLVSFVLLGGRQLGLGVLMHECGHGSLFKTRALNKFMGKWFAAAPVFYRIDDYMKNHLEHHRKIGSLKDPDLHRYEHYPLSAQSFKRKIIRDLTGKTTWNYFHVVFNANNIICIDNSGKKRFSIKLLLERFFAPIISNLTMIAVFFALSLPWLYLLWIGSYFSTYMFFSRVRNLAEHAAVPDLFNPDPLKNTRTTLPRWWERLTFAPNSVCYHLEHHLVPSIPKYRLAEFHKQLEERGLLEKADISIGYLKVVRKLMAENEVEFA